jgi:hypothetical protein
MGTPTQHRILDNIHSQLVTLADNDCKLLAGKPSICLLRIRCGYANRYRMNLSACIRLEPIFRAWSEFSGYGTYPIRSPYTTTNELCFEIQETAYFEAKLNNTFWCNDTQYGRDRRKLLLFVIDYLERAETDDILLDSLYINIDPRMC